MNINCVITSYNYSDFLCHTLPSIRTVFDRTIILTSKTDEQTKKICKYWNVEFLETELPFSGGAKFNKGLAIQFGLDYLNSKDWVVTMDSDIFLPPRFNEFIRTRTYKKDCLYGIDRLEVKNWETWINFYTNPFPMMYTGSTWAGLPLMYRCCNGYNWHPLGFYQMWHSQCEYAKGGYPTNFKNAADSDLSFSAKYPPENRILIPEIFVYHLSSEGDNPIIGRNWNKRQSPKFGPKEQ